MDPFCPIASSPGGNPLSVGDFIYLQPTDAELDPYIARIEAVSWDTTGKQQLQVRWFYRTTDVKHPLPTSDLGNRDVFYTNYFDTQAANHVVGHCKVLTRGEYDRLQGRIPGIKDVYACEYSYCQGNERGFSPLGDGVLDPPGSDPNTGASNGVDSAAFAKSLAQELLEIEKEIPQAALREDWSDLRLAWILKAKATSTIEGIGSILLELESGLELEGLYELNPSMATSSRNQKSWRMTVSSIRKHDLMEGYVRQFKQDMYQCMNFFCQEGSARVLQFLAEGRQKKRLGDHTSTVSNINSTAVKPVNEDSEVQSLHVAPDNPMTTTLFDQGKMNLKQSLTEFPHSQGTCYEIAHKYLPPEAPLTLKVIRIVMVVETTRLHVTVKYPSEGSLQLFFGLSGRDSDVRSESLARSTTGCTSKATVMGTKPELDEELKLSRGVASRLLVRQVSCTEVLHQAHLRSFWVLEGTESRLLQNTSTADGLSSGLCAPFMKSAACPDRLTGGASKTFPSDNAGGHNHQLSARQPVYASPNSQGSWHQQLCSTPSQTIRPSDQRKTPSFPTAEKLLMLTQYLDFSVEGNSSNSFGTQAQQVTDPRDHMHAPNSNGVWRNRSVQRLAGHGLSGGQENMDPQRNDDVDILALSTQKGSRVTTTSAGATDVALLGNNIDLIARHAVSDAERMRREELEGEMTWGTRRRTRCRGNPSSETALPASSSDMVEVPEFEAASDSRKLRKPARPAKSTRSQVQKTMADCCPSTATGPSSSLATRVSAGTKDDKASKAQTRADGMLKLPKDMQGRWSTERYKSAQLKLVDIMHLRGAVARKPILRNALRDEARKHIGDTGLLDHLLKHMTDTVVNSGERFRRKHNPLGNMEYWLEDEALMDIRKAAGIDDPWWIPPPGWKLGDKVPARGEYVYSQGMSPKEAAEMKRLQDMVSKMRSEMKLLSVQVKDLSKKVSAVKSDDPDSKALAQRVSTIENDLQNDIRDTYEKMELEIRNIRREIESRIQESLKHQSAILHKANFVDRVQSGTNRSSGELDQVDDTDLSRSNRPDSQEQLDKLESQFQSTSEEWRRKFDQMGADKTDIEGHFSTMCKVVNRIQEDMQSIMKALGFSKHDLRDGEVRNGSPQLLAPGVLDITTSYDQVEMGTGMGSTRSMIESAGNCNKQGATGVMVEQLQVQNLVGHLMPSNASNKGPQLQTLEETTQPPSGQLDLCTVPGSWQTSTMPVGGSFRAENAVSPQLLPIVGSASGSLQEMTSQSVESNIHMLLRLPPKNYVSSLLQRNVDLQGVIPNGIPCEGIETHHSSIYGGLVHSHVSPSQAGPTLFDYQHQHQEENRQSHVTVAEETPVHNPALPAATENMGTADFPSRNPTCHMMETQEDQYPDGMRSPSGGHGWRFAKSLHLKDSQTSCNVPTSERHNVQSADGAHNTRRKQVAPAASLGKRKYLSSTVMSAPLTKRQAKEAKEISRIQSISGGFCTSTHNELSTQLSLCVTTAQANPGAVSDFGDIPLESQVSTSMGSSESALSEQATTLREICQGSPGTRNSGSASGALEVQLESSWLGLSPSPRSPAYMPRC